MRKILGKAGEPLFLSLLGSTFCFLGFLSVNKIRPRETARQVVTAPPLSSLHPLLLELSILGQKNLYDDFMHIWMLQSLADDQLVKSQPEQVEKAILQVAKHSPKIETFYMLSCIVIFESADPRSCEPLIISGLKAFPNSWRLPMMLAYVYHFKLNDYAKAAAMFGLASSRQNSPEYVARLAKKLINRENLSEEEIQGAFDMMLQVPGGRSHFNDILQQRKETTKPQ